MTRCRSSVILFLCTRLGGIAACLEGRPTGSPDAVITCVAWVSVHCGICVLEKSSIFTYIACIPHIPCFLAVHQPCCTPVAKALLLRKHSCCKKKVKHVARRITTESYKETQWLACMSSKRKLEQEIIEGTHAQETPAYQRRPTTLHEVQGRNSPIRTLYMQVAKIPPTLSLIHISEPTRPY